MTLAKEGKLLRIFIGERDRHDHLPLYEWIVRRAREEGVAGATVLRGVEGFGAKTELHKANILRLSADLPIVIEIVDVEEKIESFLAQIDDAISEGLATVERVEVRFRRSGSGSGSSSGGKSKGKGKGKGKGEAGHEPVG